VLIVDDEELLRRALVRVLAPVCDVVAYPSAIDALDRVARGERFDVIFIDAHLPDMDGRTFYARLRMRNREHADRIVFLVENGFTAQDDAATRYLLASIPAHRALRKPLDLQAILRIVEDSVRAPPSSKSGADR
jgi:CheY-like chemotaxis protein